MAQVLERARRAGVVIYSVIVVDPNDSEADPGVMKKLAKETGGAAFRPESPRDVMDAFAHIAGEMRSGYTISFSPPDVRDGGFRAVHVTADANRKTLVVRTRAGYYAGR